MPRAIWSGAISFGLLNVPVKLYSAVSSKNISFRQLRESDSSPIRYKRVAQTDDEEVPFEDIVKGYELGADRFVTITKEELAELAPRKTRAIEVLDFVDLDQIDPVYFDHPYLLAPDKGAAKAYSLLVGAMAERKKVAIARFVLREKEHLAAIRPMDGALAVTTMRFYDEVVTPSELGELLPDEESQPSKKELEMAEALISQLSNDFEPERYADEYRDKVMALIERKAEGGSIVVEPEAEPEPTAAPDLMAALEQSLAAVRGSRSASKAKPKSQTKPRSKPKPKPKAKAK